MNPKNYNNLNPLFQRIEKRKEILMRERQIKFLGKYSFRIISLFPHNFLVLSCPITTVLTRHAIKHAARYLYLLCSSTIAGHYIMYVHHSSTCIVRYFMQLGSYFYYYYYYYYKVSPIQPASHACSQQALSCQTQKKPHFNYELQSHYNNPFLLVRTYIVRRNVL